MSQCGSSLFLNASKGEPTKARYYCRALQKKNVSCMRHTFSVDEVIEVVERTIWRRRRKKRSRKKRRKRESKRRGGCLRHCLRESDWLLVNLGYDRAIYVKRRLVPCARSD